MTACQNLPVEEAVSVCTLPEAKQMQPAVSTRHLEASDKSTVNDRQRLASSACQDEAADLTPPNTHQMQPSLAAQGRSLKCRESKICPVCTAANPNKAVTVVNLPRHLLKEHGWDRLEARRSLQTFGLRKQRERKEPQFLKHRDYHRSRPCPLCDEPVVRLGPHLEKIHKMRRQSTRYNEVITCARKKQRLQKRPIVDQGMPSTKSGDSNSNYAETVQGDNDRDDEIVFRTGTMLNGAEDEVLNSDLDHCVEDDDDGESLIGNDEDEELVVDAGVQSLQGFTTDKTLTEFETWLVSTDGGRKTDKSAKQHKAQVRTVLLSADTNSCKLQTLWDRSALQHFTDVYAVEKLLSATTIKSYLCSIRHFYTFLLNESADLSVSVKVSLREMSDRLAKWITSYRKESAAQRLNKQDRNLNSLISPGDVAKFDRSEAVFSAVKLLGRLADSTEDDASSQLPLTQTEYCTVRDYLLIQVALSNANRSGVLANMTLKEFEDVTFHDEKYVISVADHKTASIYGAALIVLSPVLYSYVNIYIKFARRQVLKTVPIGAGRPDKLFLGWLGEALQSGQVTRATQSIWEKAGLGKNFTFNLMRKSAVSVIHENYPESSEHVADMMCHRLATARSSYRTVKRQKTSVAGAKQLELAMRPSLVTMGTLPASSAAVLPTSRAVWTEQQLIALRTSFKEELISNKVTLNDALRAKVEANDQLASLGVRKVYDRLRSEKRRTPDADPSYFPPSEPAHELDRDSDCDMIGPSIGSSRSCKFLDSEAALVADICRPIILAGPISEVRVSDTLNCSPAGRLLLTQFSLFQLINRVKYERRQLRIKCNFK